MDKKEINREEIIAEYLIGNISYRALGKKHGVPSRSICDWVMKYQGRLPSWKEKEKRRNEKVTGKKEIKLSNDVKILQKALRKSELKSELFEEMLKLSEEHTGIDLRKKFGTKQ
jgi:transposase-like protein